MKKTTRFITLLLLLTILSIAASGRPPVPLVDGGGFPTSTPTQTPIPTATATPTSTPEPTATSTPTQTINSIEAPSGSSSIQQQPTAIPPAPPSPSAIRQLMPVIFVGAFGLLITLVAVVFYRSTKKP